MSSNEISKNNSELVGRNIRYRGIREGIVKKFGKEINEGNFESILNELANISINESDIRRFVLWNFVNECVKSGIEVSVIREKVRNMRDKNSAVKNNSNWMLMSIDEHIIEMEQYHDKAVEVVLESKSLDEALKNLSAYRNGIKTESSFDVTPESKIADISNIIIFIQDIKKNIEKAVSGEKDGFNVDKICEKIDLFLRERMQFNKSVLLRKVIGIVSQKDFFKIEVNSAVERRRSAVEEMSSDIKTMCGKLNLNKKTSKNDFFVIFNQFVNIIENKKEFSKIATRKFVCGCLQHCDFKTFIQALNDLKKRYKNDKVKGVVDVCLEETKKVNKNNAKTSSKSLNPFRSLFNSGVSVVLNCSSLLM